VGQLTDKIPMTIPVQLQTLKHTSAFERNKEMAKIKSVTQFKERIDIKFTARHATNKHWSTTK
jgi:hypothetical protein